MTGSELYRTWFGLDRLTPNPYGDELRRYLVLAGDPFRSDKENKELQRLARVLEKAEIDPRMVPVPRKDSP